VKETVTKETSRDKLTAEHVDKCGVGVIELGRVNMGVNEKERERERETHLESEPPLDPRSSSPPSNRM